MAGTHLSKEFFDLIKTIGEAKSKQEEDRIITYEVAELKKRMGDRTLVSKKLKEFLIRIIYVEMLGHDASFGYMKSVELSASSNLLEKRVSYLCAGLCFGPDHEFRMMLVNRIQRDLQSANVLEASIALSAAAKILTTDMIPAVLPIIVNLLKHDQEIIRKKAVMLLHRFLQLQPESVAHLGDKFRRALCDKDPSVMSASLHIFSDLAKADPVPYKDLVSSFVSILKQVIEHRLPRDFDYHRTPAPWIQMKLLRILALLGQADQSASEQMYEVLLDVMRKADTGINVGYAIVYECVRTVTTIYPNTALLDAAAASIARFISNDNHNLKYLGVTGLAAIVKDHPKYAAEHQLAVIDCLEDSDDTLKRKTLDLLFRMTNPVNVEVITVKLLDHLRSAADEFLRTDLVSRVTQVAERFAPSNSWYISTMITVFELGGELVRPEVAMNMMRLIAEGSGESDETDNELRREAVEALLTLIDKPALPDILLQTLFWVLGEYGYLSQSMKLGDVGEKLLNLAGRAGLDPATRGYALSAVLKLTAQLGNMPPAAATLINKFGSSRQVDLAQRCHEITTLTSRPGLMRGVLPVDASTEDIEVDVDMHFLDNFVADALSAGARPYAPPVSERDEDGGSSANADGGLRFEAYERQDTTSFLPGTESLVNNSGTNNTFDANANNNSFANNTGTLNLTNMKGAWSREGYKTAQGVLQEKPVTAPTGPPIDGSTKRPWDFGGAVPNPAPTTSTTAVTSSSTSSSSSMSGLTPAPAPAPPAPRELTEKEKMAAALFGGIGATTTKTATTPAKKPATTTTTAVQPPVVPTASTTAAVKPTVAPAPAPAPKPSTVDDLFDIFGPSSTPAPAPAVASTYNAGLDDIFAAPPVNRPVTASTAPVVNDPFGSSMGGLNFGGSSSTSTASSSAAPVDLNSLTVPPALLSLVSVTGALREPLNGNSKAIGGDNTVTVGYHKIFAPDALHMVLFIVNNGTAPLAMVQLNVTAPSYLAPTVRGGNAIPGQPANTVSLGPINARSSGCLVVSLALAAIPQSGSMKITLSYPGAAAPITATIDSPITDVLRPAQMDTQAFGGVWTQPAMKAEAVATVNGSAIRTPTDLMGKVGPLLNMYPVQAISATSEAIAAARVMGLPTVFALLHARISATTLEVRIKTAEPVFTQAVAGAVSTRLK